MNIGIVRFPGSNCDKDTYNFFKDDNNVFFIEHTQNTYIEDIDLIILVGGFSYGDRLYNKATEEYTISPGTMALKSNVINIINEAHKKNVKILGICNGLQILIQMNLLPEFEFTINNNNKFVSKNVNCTINLNDSEINMDLFIANKYGQIIDKSKNDDLIWCKYNNYFNGSYIAGITNKSKNIFALFPHFERIRNFNDKVLFKQLLYKTFIENYDIDFHYKITDVLFSEHISYKSTKKYLKQLYTKNDKVIVPVGENSGIVDIGNNYCLSLKIESHNHPTFIDPYHGASTGVGGAIRDIIAVGSRPICLLDFLYFGNDDNSEYLLKEAVNGISYYGNTIGIPNVGGSLHISESYNKNPLVNVFCMGLLKKEEIKLGSVSDVDNLLILVGARTGIDGIGGASMSSKSFDNDTDILQLKNTIQKGDAFLEKLLLEACLDINEYIIGCQDLGAGGIMCATIEVLQRAIDKTDRNLGVDIYLDKVKTKCSMSNTDILISEAQERMLIIVEPKYKTIIENTFNKYDLEHSVIGKTNLSGTYKIYNNDNLIYKEYINNFKTISVDYDESKKNNINYELIKKIDNELFEQYDSTIGCRTIYGRLDSKEEQKYSILNIDEAKKKVIITWSNNFDECYNTILEHNYNPLCLVNCLNYGEPETSIYELKTFLEELNNKCIKYDVPIVGGNVSLYNCTNNDNINPTPQLVMIGLS